MRLAIMQPYVFPYLGYFQLLNAVDRFVFYDDVQFIKQGWINRNRILLDGEPFLFTIPLADAGSNKLILETEISGREFEGWRTKFFKTLESAYAKADYYPQVRSMISEVLEKKHDSIGDLAIDSVRAVQAYLGNSISTVRSSQEYNNRHLGGVDRVIDICLLEKADAYLNAPGGAELYDKNIFRGKGIDLLFLKPRTVEYRQHQRGFVPDLSILDVLMFNSAANVDGFLKNYSLA